LAIFTKSRIYANISQQQWKRKTDLSGDESMKVIAFLGSPHKGNGYRISKAIEQELKQLGVEEFERIWLKDVHMEVCMGCFACFSKGKDFCPLKDDKPEIERKLLESDGVILISPGYAWNVSGLMKNFIDRFAYTLHRPIFFDQSLMLVANGGSGLKKVMKSLSTIQKYYPSRL